MSDVARIETAEREISTLEQNANAITVENQEQFEFATAFLLKIKDYKKAVHELCDESVEKANAAHKAAVKTRKSMLDPLEAAESTVGRKMSAWFAEEQRKRRELEEKAAADAMAKAEAEKRERVADAILGGMDEAVVDAVKSAPAIPEPITPVAAPKAQGVAMVETWSFRVVDPMLVPREYLMVDEKKIGQVVRALRGEKQIPGVEVYCEYGARKTR